MMKLWKTVVIFLVANTVSLAQGSLNISLYYESLCPGCKEFVSTQVYPTYRKMQEYIGLHLVPYGNAHRLEKHGKWTFRCQHGPEECYGSKVQACALNTDVNEYQKVEFVGCLMGSEDPASPKVGQKCASRSSLHWDLINKCASGDEGDTLLAENGKETDALNPPHTYVPWILLDGVYNSTMNDEAMSNLLGVVCNLLKEKPDICNDTVLDIAEPVLNSSSSYCAY